MSAQQERAVLLLAPSYDHDEYLFVESLGLRAIAGVLHGLGARVHVFDECAIPPPDKVREHASSATLVGLGVLFTRQIPDAIELVRHLRRDAPRAYFVAGGQGLQFLWKEVMQDCPELNSACMYEGDQTIVDLWTRLISGQGDSGIRGLYTRKSGHIITSGPRPPVEKLDNLPFTYRKQSPTAYPNGHATMSTSRGCSAHCTFCQSGNYANRYHQLPKWRHRSTQSIIEEIRLLHYRYGVDAISIVDDDFLGGHNQGRQRALEIVEQVGELPFRITFSIECRVDEVDDSLLRQLRDVGLRHVLIGVESATDTDIRLFTKRTSRQQAEYAIALLRALNIDFSTGFITFQPTSTLAGVADNLSFLARNRVTNYRRLTNRLELYPGAPLLRHYEKHGIRLRVERYRIYYDFLDSRVGHLYSGMRSVLAPYEAIERCCEAERFRAARASENLSNERLASLCELSDAISSSMISSAQECLCEVIRDGKRASFDHTASLIPARIDLLRNALTQASTPPEGQPDEPGGG